MSVKHMLGQEAIEKLRKLAEGIDFCMFCTRIDKQPIASTPMSIQEVDDEGNLWFLADKNGEKYHNILSDDRVQLFFSGSKDYTFLSIYGYAALSRDQDRVDKYWNKMMEAWFEKGKEDPAITLIRVNPEDIRYWEPKDNKFVTLAKIVWSAVSGEPSDTGVEGKIKV